MKYLVFCILTLSVFACNSSSDTAIKAIKELEQGKYKTSDSLINSYLRFADGNPEHQLAPAFVFKAAQVCVKSGKLVKGARLYERMATEYSKDTLAPEALIRGGIAFASVPDPANAKRLYDLFISMFPTHPRIDEVKMWSETSGMSEEELLKRFEARLHAADSIQ